MQNFVSNGAIHSLPDLNISERWSEKVVPSQVAKIENCMYCGQYLKISFETWCTCITYGFKGLCTVVCGCWRGISYEVAKNGILGYFGHYTELKIAT